MPAGIKDTLMWFVVCGDNEDFLQLEWWREATGTSWRPHLPWASIWPNIGVRIIIFFYRLSLILSSMFPCSLVDFLTAIIYGKRTFQWPIVCSLLDPPDSNSSIHFHRYDFFIPPPSGSSSQPCVPNASRMLILMCTHVHKHVCLCAHMCMHWGCDVAVTVPSAKEAPAGWYKA